MPGVDPPGLPEPVAEPVPELHGLDAGELLARGLDSASLPTSPRLPAPGVAAMPQTEVLIFVDGAEIARLILPPGEHTFGSSDACNFQVEAAHVSRQHARLTVSQDGSLLLADLGSTNGTFLDGVRIVAPTPVRPNQSIQLGAATLLVQQSIAGAGDADGIPPELTRTIRYEPGAEIAKGGMGAVLAARQPAIRREVALKVMLRHASAHDRLRFIEEAQITGQLEHPNIVPVHDLALNEHGQPYYTMKLVRGGTLRDVLKRLAAGDPATVAKYSLAALVTTFQKICDAVAFAHARGVIHRDLKPANIMVGEFGEVLVMDWGLAKLIGGARSRASPPSPADHGRAGARPSEPVVSSAREDQREVFATLDGAVMGTPQYMSPEQALGEIATLDQRSDIFSLGAILYELVTLVPPFSGKTTREILAKVRDGDCLLPNARVRAAGENRPRHLRGGAIPDSLEAVIMKALALDRDRRYQRVEEFQVDLTAYQSGFATSAENAGAGKQLALLFKRHKALSVAIASSLLLLGAVSAAFTVRVLHERDIAIRERKKVMEANAENLRHLHEASMADYAVAVQRLDKDGKWCEGVAHLTRALNLEPGNRQAAARLYSTVSFLGPEMQNWPRQVFRHDGYISSVQFSPSGDRVVTASWDKTARVWDATTGKALGEPLRHENYVFSAQFSPDGTRIVTASADKTARAWDATTGKAVGEALRHENRVFSAQFSPDGTRIVTASADKTARVWDAATGTALGEPLRHETSVFSAQFSPDGTRIVTASADKMARVWDARTGKALGEPLRHEDAVTSARFSPDGTRIVTASRDKTARVWDAVTGKAVGEALRHEGAVGAQFSPDGAWIVTASEDKTARVWDAATGKAVGEALRHENAVRSAQFSPDGTRIVTASNETARLWDAATGKALGEPLRHEGAVRSAQFSPEGTRIVTASNDKTARVWDAVTGKAVGEALRHENAVGSAQFSPEGTRIVTASQDKTARVWDAATGKALGEPLRHGGDVRSAQFSPDGTRIVTASWDKTAGVWDAATGKALGEALRHKGPVGSAQSPVRSAQFSPDGTRIVTASGEKAAQVWDAAMGKPVGEALRHGSDVVSAQFSPDGTRIVTASADGTARVWDAVTGKAVGEALRHETSVFSAQFSPDGTRIVTASWDKTARVWDAATGKAVGEALRHGGAVRRAQFSPDGTRIVTESEDRTARVWDAATGKALGETLRHEDYVFSAQFSPDGTRIVTASADMTARIWPRSNLQRLSGPVPEWMRERAAAIAGLEFDSEGELHAISLDVRRATILKVPVGNDDWAVLARWVALPAAERTLTPDSQSTCRGIAERERDFGSKESLESALRYDTTVPLARLLLAKFEENPQRAAFLRDYDFKRLPDDPALWVRAAQSLHEQKDDPRARQALQKLEKLDPEKASALTKELGL